MDTEEEFARAIDSRVIQTGPAKYSVTFTHRRRPVPTIELRGDFAELLFGFSQITSDLNDALAWVTESEQTLKDESPNSEISALMLDVGGARRARGLFIAALVSYGKCFAESRGRRSRVQKNQLDKKFHAAHEYFMTMRNAYAAHSGIEKFEKSRLYLLIHPKYKKNSIAHLRVEGNKPNLHVAAPDGTLFEDLIKHVSEIALNKKMETRALIAKEHLAPRGLAYWVAMSKKVASVELNYPPRRGR